MILVHLTSMLHVGCVVDTLNGTLSAELKYSQSDSFASLDQLCTILFARAMIFSCCLYAGRRSKVFWMRIGGMSMSDGHLE